MIHRLLFLILNVLCEHMHMKNNGIKVYVYKQFIYYNCSHVNKQFLIRLFIYEGDDFYNEIQVNILKSFYKLFFSPQVPIGYK